MRLGGVARYCLALWSSEQVDRHLLPVQPWVWLWGADSSQPGGSPHVHGCPRAAGGRGQWPAVSSQEAPVSHLPLSCVCPFLCYVLRIQLFLDHPTPGVGLLRGLGALPLWGQQVG